jgi:hypothetical protein
MTPVRRIRGIAAVLATLTAATLATTAQGEAHAATAPTGSTAATPAAAAGRGAAAMTRIHLHVSGCDRCSIALQHAITHSQHVWTSRKQKVGSDHRVTFKIRTARTKGLSFVVDAPWERDTGAVSNMVTRYPGHRVDSSVTRKQARHAARAEGCWAGTRLDEVWLGFHVARVPARSLPGHLTHIPLAYATHTMASWAPKVKTFKGTIGNQDAFYCTKPRTTKLTLQVPQCHSCEIDVMNGAIRPENTWAAEPKRVRNGSVTFTVPRPDTRGISATVTAPWEGTTGYTTLVAFRYAGHRVGDPVTFTDARSRRHASPCWGGTTAKHLTVPLTVRQVRVPGTTGPTKGTLAYADVTQPWLAPMMQAGKGVLGSQEVITCHR